MKAIIQNGYGTPDILELKDIDKPQIKDKEVLIRVKAAAIHAGDYFGVRGDPFIVRFAIGFPNPKNYVPGFDVAGVVEEVGTKVTDFKPGDEVFGEAKGSCAEYTSTAEDKLVLKPSNISFEQAATVAVSGVTALMGIRDVGKVKPGHKVLINGASGGVGTYAIQIARAFGAEVTGVCSTKNVEMLNSIGANHVIDYTKEDFTKNKGQYDLILDNVANRSISDCRSALSPAGKFIPNSGNAGMGYIFKAFFLSIFLRQQGRPYLAVVKNKELIVLKELLESGKVIPVIDRTYSLSEIPEAMAYIGEGHARGKVVITI